MPSSVLSTIRNKYEDAGASVDKMESVTALIAAAPKDYMSSISTQKGQWEGDILLVTVKEIVKEMLDWMPKMRNVISENDDENDGEVMFMNVEKNSRELVLCVERKGIGNFAIKRP